MTLEEFAKAVAKYDDNLRWLDLLGFGQWCDEARQAATDTTRYALTDQGVPGVGVMADEKVRERGGDLYRDEFVQALIANLDEYELPRGPKATLVKEIFDDADELEDIEWI